MRGPGWVSPSNIIPTFGWVSIFYFLSPGLKCRCLHFNEGFEAFNVFNLSKDHYTATLAQDRSCHVVGEMRRGFSGTNVRALPCPKQTLSPHPLHAS